MLATFHGEWTPQRSSGTFTALIRDLWHIARIARARRRLFHDRPTTPTALCGPSAVGRAWKLPSIVESATSAEPGGGPGAGSTDAPSAATIGAMPMWRCPHCGTPQPESARCWVCHRSSTCCATCRQFRPSIAAGLAYCGLDPGRRPLAGDEIRPCWVSADEVPAALDDVESGEPAPPRLRTPVRSGRDFVPVEVGPDHAEVGPAAAQATAPRSAATAVADPDAWSLFPDLEG